MAAPVKRAATLLALVVAFGCGACGRGNQAEGLPIPGADRPPAALRLEPVGRYDFIGGWNRDPELVAEELSGLAWLHDSVFVAVSDQHAFLHFLVIDVDPRSGAVRRARFDGARALGDADGRPLERARGFADREGIVADEAADRVWLSQEKVGDPPGPAIAEHRLSDGRLVRAVDPRNTPGLAVFRSARSNLAFESLTRTPDGGTFWTANEEALEKDGPTPTAERGTVVRLQALDRDLVPLAQVAYETDPHTGPIRTPEMFSGRALSGVSDLLAVDGGLLVLERMFAGDANGFAQNRIRIYQVDLRAATDVSRGRTARGLAGRTYTPAAKRLLAELTYPLSNSNFEGMALGPPLENGDRSMLLIADNNAGPGQALFALRLALGPAP